MVDGNKVVVLKKDSLSAKCIVAIDAIKSGEENSVVGNKANSTKTEEKESISIVSNHHKDYSALNEHSESENLKVTTDLGSN